MQNSTALLILVPTRLGVQEINPAYFQPILQTFQFPQSVGIAGGKPNSAFYFVGAIEKSETLICLDPHNSRPAVSPTIDQLLPEVHSLSDNLSSYNDQILGLLDIS